MMTSSGIGILSSARTYIAFTGTGADIDPVIVVGGAPNIAWEFGDGQESSLANPGLISFGGAATREHRLKVDNWSAVTQFVIDTDNITKLDNLQLLTSLTSLSCHINAISVLDVSALTLLTDLYCAINSISVLDVSALTSLTVLYCANNSISVLDVSALTLLTYLNCYDNAISVLDVSALTSLTYLSCPTNSISVLDVSALTLLTTLYCYDNAISVLDVSALTSLSVLYCNDNGMASGAVDNVLVALDANGQINGTCYIHGTNAAPGAPGLAAKANLIAKGWTCVTS
ncbi:MAG: hypothetical protein KKB31_07605 [Nanoarchaeota archaeon]|nr:hypothetical protein [Nanoarchaeota archaeon]